MMKEQKTESAPEASGAKKQVQEPSTPVDPHVEELKDLAVRHGRATLLAVVIFLVVAVPIFLTRYYRKAAKEKALAQLSSATQPADLENLIKEYPDTPAAPVAMLTLAHSLYDRQEYAKAQALYDDFISKYAKHQMIPVAEMGKAHCLEGKGLLDEALKAFESFIASHKSHYLTPQAILAKARCLNSLGRAKDSRIVLEDFLSANSKSPWKSRAEEMLEELKRGPVSITMPKTESFRPPSDTNTPLPSLLPSLPPLGK